MNFARLKPVLTIISLIPLCTELGYIWGAWRQSPLDSKNWLFVVVALLLGVIFRRRIAGWAQTRIDWRALVPVVICIAGLVFGELRHIHALVILSAVGLTSSTVLLMYGETLFIGTLPLFVLLALGCPSTGYWSGYYFRLLCGIDLAGLTLKLIAAAVLAAGFIWVRRPAKLHTVFFVAAAVLVAGAMVAKLNPPRFGEPVRLRENLTRVGGWIGVSESPSAGERRFFSGCEVSRWVFFRKDGGKSGGVTSLVLLAVKLGGDVHKLHPTELCMRSGGREVISNREKVVDTTQGPLAVQELRSAGGVAAAAHLTYTWYVGPHWSTGNFMTFRRVWQKGDAWLSYQLVATGGDSEKSAAETIEKFINDALAGGCNE